MQAMRRVRQLPPMESLRKCVSLEERYGTCCGAFLDSASTICSHMPIAEVLKTDYTERK